MNSLESILIFGCGNMAGAMLQGWLAGGIDPARFTVVTRAARPLPEGVTGLVAVPGGHFDAVLLGVKPQVLDQVAPLLAPLLGPDTVLLSILAGVEIASLAARFPNAGALVRIMPNLAAAIGRSPVALDARGLDEAGRAAVTALMAPLGTPEWLASESLFDAVTALAGCGPAFVYRFIDALAEAAAGMGIEGGQARRLALAMVDGAARLAAVSPQTPGELADRVASPGGATRAGLDVLDAEAALARVVDAALTAARDRSAGMAAAARNG